MIRSRLAAVIVLLALFLSFSAFGNLFGVRSLLISAVYPFQFAANAMWKGVTGIPSSILNLRNLAKENSELKEKLNLSLSKNALFDELFTENERLRKALGFQEGNRYRFKLLPARAIGKGASPWLSILEVSRGAAAGVRVNMPVMVKEGLVGRVIEVSHFSSKVLLITDTLSAVSVVDQRSRDFGAAEGTSSDTLLMKYVSVDGDVQEGDRIVTSSISSVFPSGIPVGTVTKVLKKESDLFYEIEIKPSVNFSKLEEVFLVF